MLYSQQLAGQPSVRFSDSSSQSRRGFTGPAQKIDRRCLDKCFCKSETLEIIRYEFGADAASLASDGQYWRSVFGGARIVLGVIRCSPNFFLTLRLLLTGATACVFYYQVTLPATVDWHALLYFDVWICIVQSVYFILASGLTIVATTTKGSICRTTPFLVRLTEVLYATLLPSTVVNFLNTFLVEWMQYEHCIPSIAQHAVWRYREEIALDAALLGIVLLDSMFNRQPYYASFSATLGGAFVYSYLGFTGIYQAAGGTDVWGHGYIYRCLDWSLPLQGSRTATGKLLMLNFFIWVPIINFVFWFLLWARRRTLAYAKLLSATSHSHSAGAGSLLPAPNAAPLGRRYVWEYSADYRDLRLDGRHWQAQFGGASRATDESVGAYVCCNSCGYAVTRFLFAALSIAMLEGRILQFVKNYPQSWWSMFLYMQNWLLVLACAYFIIAFLLTARATCLPGQISPSTPILVWVAWALNGMLLPFGLCTAILYPFVAADSDDFTSATVWFDWCCVYITVLLIYVDAFINRQPYYATFHGFIGIAICWAYQLFLILFPALGGINERGDKYIYYQWTTPSHWTSGSQIFTVAKVFTVQVLVLVPIFHAMYWCTIWAVRRARVAAKKQERMG